MNSQIADSTLQVRGKLMTARRKRNYTYRCVPPQDFQAALDTTNAALCRQLDVVRSLTGRRHSRSMALKELEALLWSELHSRRERLDALLKTIEAAM